MNCRRENEKNRRIRVDKANCIILFIVVLTAAWWIKMTLCNATRIYEWYKDFVLVELFF